MTEPEVNQWLVALLGGFERLSELISRFEEDAGRQPELADMLFAILSAKEASDRAAMLLRNRLRRA